MLEFAPGGASELYQRSFAGDSFNTAVYMARAGLPTRYLTRLGDDTASMEIVAYMQAQGIDTSLVSHTPGRNPGLYLISNDSSGERTFSYYRDSSPARETFDEPIDLQADVFYFTGITLAVTRSGLVNLVELLRTLQAGATRIVFDPNYRPTLWKDPAQARSHYEAVLGHCQTVLPTLGDDRMIWGVDSAQESVDFYRARGAQEIVVKGDDYSAHAWSQDDQAKRKADPVPAADTTGAGDAFNAGYLACRLQGHNMASSLAAAQALAARVVQHRGAILPADIEHSTEAD